MPGYTNKRNRKVEVSQEHLDTAIEIKRELEKRSPTHKVSWAEHKRLMEAAGFSDSENSGNYRLMIRAELNRRGNPTKVDSLDQYINPEKTSSLREAVGDLKFRQLEMQAEGRDLNKLKKQTSEALLWQDRLLEGLAEHQFSPIKENPIIHSKSNEHEMIAVLSDIHFGAVVDLEENQYNTEIAAQRLNDYADKLIEMGKQNHVENIHVVNIGDIIENPYMRHSAAYNSQRTLVDQTIEVTDLIIGFLGRLAQEFKVDYAAIAGNHDRIVGKNHGDDNLFADDVITISNKIIEYAIKTISDRIAYIQAPKYHYELFCKWNWFEFVHGDRDKLNKPTILAELSNLYGKQFSLVVGGHIHHNVQNEVGDDQYVTTVGSLKGTDDFSLRIGARASVSQGVILVDSNSGEFETKIVKL